jgi:hypothetical protein
VLRIDPPTEEARRLWRKVAELARAFGEDRSWCLVGGLMVQLHAYEHAATPRPTEDIDVLGDARRRPRATEELARIVTELGGEPDVPPTTDHQLGYRFGVGGQLVEILGPDGLKSPPKTVGGLETIEVQGGTQALRRAETITVSVAGDPPVQIRRPSLLAAILLKVRALGASRRKFEDHRHDLILLLGLVDDPRAVAEREELTASEGGWLRAARQNLDLGDPILRERFSDRSLDRARQALDLLSAA